MTGKIVVTGAAGLLGQNLVPRLTEAGFTRIVGIDKHPVNVGTLARLNPTVEVIQSDLAGDDLWRPALQGCEVLVVGHAQIGGLYSEEFDRNNVEATRRLLEEARRAGVRYVVHISSSVVNSMAVDDYSRTKRDQEALYDDFDLPFIVLRPTLMFGWFDRKHLGWLARFMKKVPVFPVPGSGRFIRQPLYIGDFVAIIVAAIRGRMSGRYNISGQERIDYIDLIRGLKQATGSKALIQRIPYGLFWMLLRTYQVVDRNPPFTTKQLEALVLPETFEVIDWPGIFGVRATPLAEALRQTFQHPVYSDVALAF